MKRTIGGIVGADSNGTPFVWPDFDSKSYEWPPAGMRVLISWDEPEPVHRCSKVDGVVHWEAGQRWKLAGHYVEFCPFCGEKLE